MAAAESVVWPAIGGSIACAVLVCGAAAAVLSHRRRVAQHTGRYARGGEAIFVGENPLSKVNSEQSQMPQPSASITWQRHVDGGDTWFISSNGDSEWILPEGAVMGVEN